MCAVLPMLNSVTVTDFYMSTHIALQHLIQKLRLQSHLCWHALLTLKNLWTEPQRVVLFRRTHSTSDLFGGDHLFLLEFLQNAFLNVG